MKAVPAFFFFIIINFILNFSGCTNGDYRASYELKNKKITISVELVHLHPFLAEYDRFIILSQQGSETNRQKLFPDTGGYSTANLYRCSQNRYMLKGYFDQWIIDVSTNSIMKGFCENVPLEYLGVFDIGDRVPWGFFPPSERREQNLNLEMDERKQ